MPASARRSVYLMETYWAGSTGRRNTFSLTGLQALVQSFGGSSPSEGLAGPCIERVSNNCEYVRTVCAQIGSFREVLSKQSIGVLVRSALPPDAAGARSCSCAGRRSMTSIWSSLTARQGREGFRSTARPGASSNASRGTAARSCFRRRSTRPARAAPTSGSGTGSGGKPASRTSASTTSVTRMPATR